MRKCVFLHVALIWKSLFQRMYPIIPVKGAAPLSGSIKDFLVKVFIRKENRQKREHAPFFVTLIF